MDGPKAIIVGGQPAVEKGGLVESRCVVAAHKLQSELGVDARFTEKLDEFGYGRHVPSAARDAIYDKLPDSRPDAMVKSSMTMQSSTLTLNGAQETANIESFHARTR